MVSAFAPVLLLVGLAPLFGEYLLGNQTLSEIGRLPLLACLYGPAAVVIRETVRRRGRGTGSMLALAAAFGLIVEGVIVQMLFNPALVPKGISDLPAVVPWLGADLWIALIVVAHHAIYSITLPIILTESLFAGRHSQPWLGPTGYKLALGAMASGAAGMTLLIWSTTGYFAAPYQWGCAIGLAMAIVIAALRSAKPPIPPRVAGAVPPPLALGAAAFGLTSAYMLTFGLPGWFRVLACLGLALVGVGSLSKLSRRKEWLPRHRLWVAGGCLCTSAWLGTAAIPSSGPRGATDAALLVGLALGSLLLWVLALIRLRTRP